MKKSDLIIMSMGNLWRRKLRTILTLLGVVIGTTSIIIMVSLGIGMKASIDNSLKEWGSLNVIRVYPQDSFRGKENSNSSTSDSRKKLLNDESIKEFEAIQGVDAVSPVKEMSVKLRHGKYYAFAQLKGLKKELLVKQNIKIADGDMFDDTIRNNFLFGGRVAQDFSDPRTTSHYDGGYYDGGYYEEGPGDQPLKVNVMEDALLLNPDFMYGTPRLSQEDKKRIPRPVKITVSGVIEPGNWELDSYIFTSLETFNKIEEDYEKWQKKIKANNPNGQGNETNKKKDKRKQEYQNVEIFVEKIDDIEKVEAKIKQMGFRTFSMVSMAKEARGFADIAQLVLGGIGAVSLLVAAIGISNTMVMSIYERTKEIGVMKVIGASLEDIQGMFLTEAALIGLIGGIIGLLFSTGGSMLLNFLTKNVNIFGGSGEGTPISLIPLWLYLLGMVFTTGVGLISGYLPARRAMKLSVLKALRNE